MAETRAPLGEQLVVAEPGQCSTTSYSRVTEPRTALYVDHAAAMGGAEHSLLGLLKSLDRDRYRPVLAAVDGPLAEAARELGVTVRLVPLGRLQRTPAAPWHLARGAGALLRVARTERPALIHANTLRAAMYASAAAAAALTRRPLVWHVRDIHRRGPAARWLCRQADAVIAISQAVAGALPCSDRADVIYNPVVAPLARPRSRAELGLPAEGSLVASVGRLRPWKGHGAFLEAAARVRQPNVRFVVVGGRIFRDDEPDYRGELEHRARALGLADRVTFTGQRADLADIWPHLSLLVHAARAEPFGRVVAESLAAGVPVVAFRDGGVPEIVDDGASGLLVFPGDVTALAAGIDRLLADPDTRARFGRFGQQASTRRFAPELHARAVERLYDRLLLSGRGGG